MSGTIPSHVLEKFSTFGDLLRFLRRRAGITQIELAIAVGYSDGQISRLEQNLRLPDIPTLQARFVSALSLEDEPEAVAKLLELAANVRREDAPGLGICPYKGLNYFDEADADLFVGRETLTTRLMERVLALTLKNETGSKRFLAVVGASGSGKSSLVRAGLVPALRWHPASANWPIYIFTPTAHPLESLAMIVTAETGSPAAIAALIDDLNREPRSLSLFLKRALKSMRGSQSLLVIDQFEELFALCRSEQERTAFIDNLLSAVCDHDGPVAAVITLRADFYAACAGYPQLRKALASQQEYIGAMSAEELRRAIEEPARRGRWELESGLVDLLIHEVGSEPGALPLLSHALLETWQRRRGRTLTFSGYASSGGVRGAIAETAEAVVADRFTPEQQVIARRIFLRLTELGDEATTGDTRRRATFRELLLRPEEAGETQAVLKALTDARLIITHQDSVEVAHEALIREWPTLRGWLEDNREGLKLHRHLTEAAQDWQAANREPDGLYRGARLAQASEWAEAHTEEMNALEREFLHASQALMEQEAAEREVARQRELEAAQLFAQSEQRRAAEQARFAHRVSWLAAGLAVFLLAAVILASITLRQRDQVEAQARLASSRELAMASVSNLNVDPERSLLLALEAVKLAENPDTETALHLAVQASRIQRTIQTDEMTVVGIAFSPDGRQLATGNYSSVVRIYDRASGKEQLTLSGHTAGINMVKYSPDGARVATASDDGTAKVWNSQSGQEIFTLHGHEGFVSGVAFSPDGKRLATISQDGTAHLWDAATGENLLILAASEESLRDLAFSPDGSRLVTAGDDQTARVWEVSTGRAVIILSGHEGVIDGVAYSPDGKYIATASADKTAKLWDSSSGEELQSLVGHTNVVQGIAFSPRGDRLATGSYDGRVKIWSIPDGIELLSLSGRAVQIYRVAFHPDGLQVASANSDGTAQLWDVSSKMEYMTFTGHQAIVNSVIYSPDGKRLVTASEDGTAAIWDAKTGQALVWLRGHTGSLIRAIFSPDGSRVATASDDLTVRVWESATGKELAQFSGHTRGSQKSPFSGILDAAFNPDGTHLASAGSDSKILIRDIASGGEVMQLSGHTARANSIAYHPDGALLASGSDDQTIKIWDTVSGKEIRTLKGHTDRVWRVVFSPDGTRLASGSTDATVKLWDVRTGRQLMTLSGHTSTVFTVVFSRQMDRLASVSVDGTAKVWDAQSGKELLTLSDTIAFSGVDFSPDGSHLATSRDDGTVQIYFLQVDDLMKYAQSHLTRWFTEEECFKYLHKDTCPVQP